MARRAGLGFRLSDTPDRQPASGGLMAPFAVLGVALIAVSHGAIFVRLADAPPLAIAAWRVGLAAIVVLPLAAVPPRRLDRRKTPLILAAGAGLFLALHFATWIASLERTTIARSVLLVSTSPIWVALIETVTGRSLPSRTTVVALLLATAGAAVVGGAGFDGTSSVRGDALALAGGMAMAGYLMLSREAQTGLPFRTYLGMAYGAAAAVLWIAVLVTGTQAAGFSRTTWWALAGMAFISQLVGHSGYNWSLRHLSPLFVSVVSVGEPVLASMLAWWLLGEELNARTGAGGALILAGIALATRAARPREARRARRGSEALRRDL